MEEDISRDHPDIRHYLVNTTTESLRAVEKGKADATIATLIEADHYIRVNNLRNLKVIGETKYENQHRMGVRKGDVLLLSIMQKAVRSLSAKDRQFIEDKWISKQKNGFPAISTFAFPLFVVCLLLIVLISLVAARRKKIRKTRR